MKRPAALLLGALLLPAGAHAQGLSGPYVNVAGGLNIVGTIPSSYDPTKVRTSLGPVALIDLGWSFRQGFRAEIEGSYRSNPINGFDTRRVNGTLQPLGTPYGKASTYAIMANVAYDIPAPLPAFPIQPYISAGVGYGWLDFSGGGTAISRLSLAQNNSYVGPTDVTFGAAGAFAYQAMIGAALPVQFISGLSLTLEYRFFGMTRADVPVTRTASNRSSLVNGAVPSNSTRNGFEERSNAVLLGLRYTFGGPR